MSVKRVMMKDKLNDEIFRFICIEAMRNAVIQLAYKGKKKHSDRVRFMVTELYTFKQ